MPTPSFREIEQADIPALFVVRSATHENRLTHEELQTLGITEDTVRERLAGTCRGWLCEAEDHVVGFAIGDRATGEMWVIAVLPSHLGQGVGATLLSKVERWLQASGCRHLWLTTDVDERLRAYGFYRRQGWRDERIEDGLRYMVKDVGEGPASTCAS